MSSTALVAGAVACAALAIAAWAAYQRPHSPGDRWGLAAGAAGAALLVLDAVYAARRHLGVRPFRSAAAALRVHTAAGALALLFALLHTGFRLPAGPLGWALLLTLLASTGSGAAGLLLQRRLPGQLAALEDADAPYDGVGQQADALRRQAEAALAGASDALKTQYERELAPLLAADPRQWRHMRRTQAWRRMRTQALRDLSRYLPTADRPRADALERLMASRLDLDARAVRQRLLRLWLWTHVPPSMLLLGLLAWHGYAVWLW